MHTFLASISRRCCSEHRPLDWLNKDDKSALTRELRNAHGYSPRRGARDLLHRGTRYPGRSAGFLGAGKKIQAARSRGCALSICVRSRVLRTRLYGSAYMQTRLSHARKSAVKSTDVFMRRSISSHLDRSSRNSRASFATLFPTLETAY